MGQILSRQSGEETPQEEGQEVIQGLIAFLAVMAAQQYLNVGNWLWWVFWIAFVIDNLSEYAKAWKGKR